MTRWSERFGNAPILLGVVHLAPLPGSARAPRTAADAMVEALDRARADVEALERGGFAGAVIENFFDAPFHGDVVPPETIAAMARVAADLRRVVSFPLGANVLRNDARAALAIAAACDLDFVRVNVHVGAMITDQGVLQGHAAETLSERRRLGAERVLLLCDVLVKHAAPMGGTRAELLPQLAEDTFRRGLADALVITGAGTGKATPLDDVATVRRAVPEAPVLVGSGTTDQTVADVLRACHGAIVGTWTKVDGKVDAPVDEKRVARLAQLARGLKVAG